MTSLTVSWFLVTLNHWQNFGQFFLAKVLLQIFDHAKIARWRHYSAQLLIFLKYCKQITY